MRFVVDVRARIREHHILALYCCAAVTDVGDKHGGTAGEGV